MAQGTWVQPGNPLNALNPFNYDLGLTEGLTSVFGGNTKQASTFNNPAVWAQAANPNPQSQVYSYGGTNTAINPVNYQAINNKTAGTNLQTGGVVKTGTTGGDVLGTNTNVPPGPTGPSYEDIMRGQISSGWDSYVGELNYMLSNGLPSQRSDQEQQVNASVDQNINQANSNLQTGLRNLDTTQATNLKDLTENIKNLFQAGNTYLGSRGAADSSAANQYSYAVTKMGTKERSNIIGQIDQRRQNLTDIANSEISRLNSERTQQLSGIAQWFSTAQNSIRQQIASAGLNKQKDIQALSQQFYNQAMDAVKQINQDNLSKRQTLMNWVNYNASSIQQVTSALQSMGLYQPVTNMGNAMPQITPEGNMYVPAGYGNTSQRQKDIFGNPIS